MIIVLDRRTDTLLVARDPVGVRPWYLASANGDPIGASDIATLVALPGVDGTIDETTVIHYLAAVTQSRGPTVYREVTTLRPGETWLMSQGRSRTLTHHRWNLDLRLGHLLGRCRGAVPRRPRAVRTRSPRRDVVGGHRRPQWRPGLRDRGRHHGESLEYSNWELWRKRVRRT